MEYKKIYITGHRNPDVDSITSAYALADLRRRTGLENVQPLCPGRLPDRAEWVFNHFGVKPPVSRGDVYVRISDLVAGDVPYLKSDMTLRVALGELNKCGEAALPVVDGDMTFVGMLEPAALLEQFLAISGEGKGLSLAGRTVRASSALIRESLNAEVLSGGEDSELYDWDVFVAASSVESFGRRMSSYSGGNKLIVISGDRTEILLDVIERGIPLLIVTGNAEVRPTVLAAAKVAGTAIYRTRYDSAKTTRLLKFATPAGSIPLEKEGLVFQSNDRAHDFRNAVLRSPDNVFPVLDQDRKLVGVVRKGAFAEKPPFGMILVDHNETEQGVPGIEELPVIEVVDHHRIAMRSTPYPIKYTADVVGSTCTIVSRMYRAAGLRPTREVAGILLAGIVSDTLLFQSPTTTEVDRSTAAWLEKLCGETAESIMNGLLSVASVLNSMTPAKAVDSDRKAYAESGYRFTLSQIEESNLAVFRTHADELAEALDKVVETERLDFAALLVTDPVRGNSVLLFRGSENVRRALPYRRDESGLFDLPGVLSRKKQLLPEILATLSGIPR